MSPDPGKVVEGAMPGLLKLRLRGGLLPGAGADFGCRRNGCKG